MTNSQRLDHVEDELETVKQLLVSTARYAESANRRLDELTLKQDRTQSQLDQIGGKVDQLSDKVDSFVTHTQRLFTRAGSEVEETKARTERLEALMLKLDRNFEEQKSQFQEFQITTGAALERIDRILDYLLRQQGGNQNPPS
ncbi:6-aminohexanoate hydrolase [Nostoc sp. 'Peltigera membranacea cyanobiont' 232]|uniref:6-aminohexanoate hydrolase n=1 Tax=Nostoc sp. 'Peltigera membranacea cyanobiont' 232 TaxID=2014531 RepID=UPI000B959F09|nr:6-aminohexanoate hydrolase [Nostoc sp. 'Peltigera membranacea cyanobiont' 232]OYE00358.1 6-aminohexanoate hydrolase [Nostoc sp. 'Peltigera membranacea cyanobiont' 232]